MMKKILFLIGILALIPIANAQQEQAMQINRPGLTPDLGILYDLLDRIPEQIQLLITQDNAKRVELRTKFLEERKIELFWVASVKPEHIPVALAEISIETMKLGQEATLAQEDVKRRVEQHLTTSREILVALKDSFANDDNLNNDNALKGIETAIESHQEGISRVKEILNKDVVEVRQNGNKIEIKGMVDEQSIRFEVLGGTPQEVIIQNARQISGKEINTDNLKVVYR